jgi:hypothetical protein
MQRHKEFHEETTKNTISFDSKKCISGGEVLIQRQVRADCAAPDWYSKLLDAPETVYRHCFVNQFLSYSKEQQRNNKKTKEHFRIVI